MTCVGAAYKTHVVTSVLDDFLGDTFQSLKKTSKTDVRTTTCSYVYEFGTKFVKKKKRVPTHAFTLDRQVIVSKHT